MRAATGGLALTVLTTFVLILSSASGGQAQRTHPSAGSAPSRAGAVVPTSATVAVLRLTLDGGTKSAGDPLHRLRSSGRAPVRVVVVTRDGGAATRVRGRGRGWAARLPAHRYGANPARASIRITNAGPNDPYSPKGRDFSFGADFRLDRRSAGSALDNGDNLLQRGLYGQAAQYKVQVDGGVPLCRIRGSDGAVSAWARPVQREQWYRVRCSRNGQAVTIRVWKLTSSGPVSVSSATRRGPIGSVAFPRLFPLSVGGKLDADGAVASGSSDQLNGVVD